MKFSFDFLSESEVAVIYQINFNTDKCLFDLEGYSSYPEEHEVLVQDGLNYTISDIKMQTNQDDKSYYLV